MRAITRVELTQDELALVNQALVSLSTRCERRAGKLEAEGLLMTSAAINRAVQHDAFGLHVRIERLID